MSKKINYTDVLMKRIENKYGSYKVVKNKKVWQPATIETLKSHVNDLFPQLKKTEIGRAEILFHLGDINTNDLIIAEE